MDVPLSKMVTHGCLNNGLIHSPKLEQVDKGKKRKNHPDKINRLYDSEQTVTLDRTPGWLTSTSIQIIAPDYSGHACANPRLKEKHFLNLPFKEQNLKSKLRK